MTPAERRAGESYLAEIDYEYKIQKLTEKIERLDAAYTRAEQKNPNDPNLHRATKIKAGLNTELGALRHLF